MVSLDIEDIAGDFSGGADEKIQSVAVNPGYGSGYLSKVVSFQSGISIVIQNFSLYGEGKLRLFSEKKEPPFIGFANFFSGVEHISYTEDRVSLGEGFSFIIDFPECESALCMEVNGNTQIQAFTVCMEPAVFKKLTGKSCSELFESLDLLDWSTCRQYGHSRLKRLDFAQKICGYQVVASFMNDPHDKIFLEAKALELVSLQLKQLDHLTGKAPKKLAADHHSEKIAYACEILRKEMANPPNKLALARRVGLNHNQLVQGFKDMLGLCPFEYLRILRLETARDLIAGRKCNVTEAAFSVGYSSLGHFSKTFKERFGINPKALAKGKTERDVAMRMDP